MDLLRVFALSKADGPGIAFGFLCRAHLRRFLRVPLLGSALQAKGEPRFALRHARLAPTVLLFADAGWLLAPGGFRFNQLGETLPGL